MAKPDNNMNKVSDYEIETMLFKQIEKPKKYHMTKVFNVFNDYYRINVYTQTEEEGYTKPVSYTHLTLPTTERM